MTPRILRTAQHPGTESDAANGLLADGPQASVNGILLGEQRPGRVRPWQVVVVVVVVIVLFALAGILSQDELFQMDDVLALALFALATNLLVGYGGLISFGQAAFYGVGAYTVALSSIRYHQSIWVGVILAVAFGLVVSVPIGLLALRTRRLYFALLMLAFSQLFTVLIQQFYSFTGGENGLSGSIGPAVLSRPTGCYIFCLITFLISALFLWFIVRSRFGLVLRATRENRERAESLGVNVYRHQLIAFIISGGFCALAGVLIAVTSQSVDPSLGNWTESGNAVVACILGGSQSFIGPVIGAIILQLGGNYATAYTKDFQLILGVILLAIILIAPTGVVGLARSGWSGLLKAARPGRLAPPPQQATK